MAAVSYTPLPSPDTLLDEEVPLEEHPYNMAVDVAALIPTILIKSLLLSLIHI